VKKNDSKYSASELISLNVAEIATFVFHNVTIVVVLYNAYSLDLWKVSVYLVLMFLCYTEHSMSMKIFVCPFYSAY